MTTRTSPPNGAPMWGLALDVRRPGSDCSYRTQFNRWAHNDCAVDLGIA